MVKVVWSTVEEALASILIESDCNEITELEIISNFDIPMYPPNLKTLVWAGVGLEELPGPLPDSLLNLNVSNNKLVILPPLPPMLQRLDGFNNQLLCLPELTETLTHLCVHQNLLEGLPELPPGLKTMCFFQNQVATLPKSIINCTGISRFDRRDNPLRPTGEQLLHLYRFFNRGEVAYWNNGENVEAQSTFDSFSKSTRSLLKDEVPKELRAEMDGKIAAGGLAEWLIAQIKERAPALKELKWSRFAFRDYNTPYQNEAGKRVNVSTRELIIRIWHRIVTFSDPPELMQRLAEEIIDAHDYCRTGYKMRLMNTLTGYYDDIVVGYNEAEAYSGMISAARQRAERESGKKSGKEFVEKWRQYVLEIFSSEEVSEEMMKTWIGPLLES